MKKYFIIFIAALLIRLVFIALWYQTGNGDRISADSTGYYPIGQSIMEGKGVRFEGQPFTRRAPVYCVFVGAISKMAPFPLGIYLIQAVLGAFSCILLFKMVRPLFGEQTAFLAAGIFSIDYATLRFTVEVMPENLFVFFMLLGFGFILKSIQRNTVTDLVWAGVFLAFSALTKDGIVYYVPFLALGLLLGRGKKRRAALAAASFFTAFVLVVLPWITRNTLLTKHFSLITTSGGHVFYLGNNPTTVGNPTGGEWRYGIDYDYPQNDPNLPPLYSWEADQYLKKKALKFILENPVRFCQMARTKVINMWRPFQTDSPRLAKWAMLLTYVPTMVFGILGLILNVPKWKIFFPVYGLLGYFFFIHIVLFGQIRFRYPVMPFIMIFAAYSIIFLWNKIVRPEKQGLTPQGGSGI